jgi:RNA polymerase sigma factor (sigma-70 family)
MDQDTNHPKLDDYAIRLIRRKAQQLVGNYGFVKDDRPDIEQDLTVDLLTRLHKFDPSRATLHTFMSRVIDNRIASMIEERKAALRDYRRGGLSLNDPLADDEGHEEERGDYVDAGTSQRMLGSSSMPIDDLVAQRIDLARALQKLSPVQRALCARIATGEQITDIAREMKVSRDTVYARMQEIKATLKAAGFDER